jgi:hypothetical protein
MRDDQVIVFHRTSHLESILEGGFRDGEGTYLTANVYRGVWVSNKPLDENEGAWGDYLLAMVIPEDVISDFEWVEEGKPYREFLVPADVLNRYRPPRLVEDRRWWERGPLP